MDGPPSFETFDHTADLGIRARGGTLEEMAGAAAAGLYAVIGELVVEAASSSDELTTLRFDSEAEDPAMLLRDFLCELLFRFDCDAVMALIETVAFSPTRLEVSLHFRAIDGARSEFYREVKAITYHELSVTHDERNGWLATFIVDI